MAFQFTDGVLSRWNFGLRGVLYWTRLTPIPSHASCYTHILTLSVINCMTKLVGRTSTAVKAKFHHTDTYATRPDPARHVRACDQVSDKVWSVSNSTTRTLGLYLRPDQTGPTDEVRTCRDLAENGRSLRPDEVRGCVGDSSGLVWSGPCSGIWT